MDASQTKKVHIKVPFYNKEHAMITHDVLSVDEEIKRSGIKRYISLDGLSLILEFEGIDLKKLRTSINATLKNVALIVKTFECLGH